MKNTICIILSFLLFSAFGAAQGWEQFYGSEDTFETGTGIIEAPDGGLVISYRGNNVNTIKKINLAGEEEWSMEQFGFSSHLVAGANGDGFFLAGAQDGGGASLIQFRDWMGEIIWEKPEVAADITRWVALPDGYVNFFTSNPGEVERWKTGLNGDLLWSDTISITGLIPGAAIAPAADGGFVIGGHNGSEAILAKFNADGVEEWTAVGDTPLNEGGNSAITATADGGFVVVNDLSGPDNSNHIAKFSGTGEFVWNSIFANPPGFTANFGNDIAEDANGDLIMAGRAQATSSLTTAYMMKLSSSGQVLFYKLFNGERFIRVVATDSGFYAAAGRTELTVNSADAYFVLTTYDGQLFPNAVQGQVALDENNDCTITTADMPLEGWVVSASGENTYYGLTDGNGQYFIEVDTGEYTLSIHPPNDLWAPCENPVGTTVAPSDTVSADFPVQAAVECPAMQVDISRPGLRRCFDNTIAVQYCNLGTVVAENARIEVTLDSLLEYMASDLPPSGQMGSTLTFDLGDVGIMECGTFQITAYVNCDAELGQTLCMEAHAFPDTICGMLFNFSGASMEARAMCEGDSVVVLELENVGTVPTSGVLEYIVIEDHIIFLEGAQIFDPMQVEEFQYPANGSTWRIISEQEPNHPGASFPTAFVEGCGDDELGGFSTGFVNEHPLADGNGFIDIDCEEVIGAFDPNDKSAMPIGYDPEHFIEPNTDLEYRIRFQNTGTDTAFNIVIWDTLSPSLNPASLRPGAASHAYEYDLVGGGVAVFTFPNIMLPDSNVNEALSHGFVNFKISQMPDLGPETEITNAAAIFFDFNEPIITNTTLHTIERDFIISASAETALPNVEVKIYPNPFAEQATFEVEGIDNEELTLNLYDGMGRLARRENFAGGQLIFRRGNLRSGIWFFQIEAEGRSVASGKLVVAQ